MFSLGHVVSFFQHGPCAGQVLRRSACWSRGALSGIAALCVACVSVVVSVNSYVLVRVFHLGSWGGPLLFREPAELQSPMEAAAPPSQLFLVPLLIRSRHRGTTDSSVIDTAPRGEGRGSIVSPPRGLIAGSREWKKPFRDFLYLILIRVQSTFRFQR